MSYTRADAPYATALRDHLTGHDLPVWMDTELGWGATFPREIAERIRQSTALIVIMSHDAQGSSWVEREILEGQRHGKPFLPVLREGERLFLLASSNYFDARDGSLPGPPELRQMQDLLVSTTPRAAAPLRAPQPRKPRPQTSEQPSSLPSNFPWGPRRPERLAAHRDVPPPSALHRLVSSLDSGRLEHADILTTSLVLDAVDRLENGWLRRSDGARLPSAVLTEIDRAWAATTSGRHGFRAQAARRPGNPAGPRASRAFAELTLTLGWRASRRDVVPRYPDFARGQEYPSGFFPTLRNPQLEQGQSWHDQWRETVLAVHSRLWRWADIGRVD